MGSVYEMTGHAIDTMQALKSEKSGVLRGSLFKFGKGSKHKPGSDELRITQETNLANLLGTLTTNNPPQPDPGNPDWKTVTKLLTWIREQAGDQNGTPKKQPKPIDIVSRDGSSTRRKYGALDGRSVIIFCNYDRMEEDADTGLAMDSSLGVEVLMDEPYQLAKMIQFDAPAEPWNAGYLTGVGTAQNPLADARRLPAATVQLNPDIFRWFREFQGGERILSDVAQSLPEAADPLFKMLNLDQLLIHELSHAFPSHEATTDDSGVGWTKCVEASRKEGHRNADNIRFFVCLSALALRKAGGIKFDKDGRCSRMDQAQKRDMGGSSSTKASYSHRVHATQPKSTTLKTVAAEHRQLHKIAREEISAIETLSIDLPGQSAHMNLPIPEPLEGGTQGDTTLDAPSLSNSASAVNTLSINLPGESAIMHLPIPEPLDGTTLDRVTSTSINPSQFAIPSSTPADTIAESMVPVLVNGTTTEVKYMVTRTSSGDIGPTEALICADEMCDPRSDCKVPLFCQNKFKDDDDDVKVAGIAWGLCCGAVALGSGNTPAGRFPGPAGGVGGGVGSGGGGGGKPPGKADSPENQDSEAEGDQGPSKQPTDEAKPTATETISCEDFTTSVCAVSVSMNDDGTGIPQLSVIESDCKTISGCSITDTDHTETATATGGFPIVTPIGVPEAYAVNGHAFQAISTGAPNPYIENPFEGYQDVEKYPAGKDNNGASSGDEEGSRPAAATAASPSRTEPPLCTPFQNPQADSGGCRCSEDKVTTTLPFLKKSDVCGYTAIPTDATTGLPAAPESNAPGPVDTQPPPTPKVELDPSNNVGDSSHQATSTTSAVAAIPLCVAFQNPSDGSGGCRCSDGPTTKTLPFLSSRDDVCGYKTLKAAQATTETVEAGPSREPYTRTVTETAGGPAIVLVCDESHEQRVHGTVSITKCDSPAKTVSTIQPDRSGETRRCIFGASAWSDADCFFVCGSAKTGQESYLAFLDAEGMAEDDMWKDQEQKPWEEGSWFFGNNEIGVQESIGYKWRPDEELCICDIDGKTVEGQLGGDGKSDWSSERSIRECICEFDCHRT